MASVAELYENDLLFSYFFQQITTDSVWFGLTFEVVSFSSYISHLTTKKKLLSRVICFANKIEIQKKLHF